MPRTPDGGYLLDETIRATYYSPVPPPRKPKEKGCRPDRIGSSESRKGATMDEKDLRMGKLAETLDAILVGNENPSREMQLTVALLKAYKLLTAIEDDMRQVTQLKTEIADLISPNPDSK